MKKSVLFTGIFLPVLFAACSPSGNQSKDTVDGHTSENSLDWAGVYAGDGEILSLTTGHAYFLEEKETADSVSRSEGTFTWDADGREISLSGNGKTYRVQENKIVPVGKDKQPVESGALSKQGEKLTDTYWRLSEINGKDISEFKSDFGREAHLIFNGEDQQASGSSGCNLISGPYETGDTPGKIKFSKFRSTLMACPGPAMDLENQFTEIIEDVAGYELREGTLLLSDAEGKVLFRFRHSLSKE